MEFDDDRIDIALVPKTPLLCNIGLYTSLIKWLLIVLARVILPSDQAQVVVGIEEGQGGRGQLFFLQLGSNFFKMTFKRFNRAGLLQIRCTDRKCRGKALLRNISGLELSNPDLFRVEYFQVEPQGKVTEGHTCSPVDLRKRINKIKRKSKVHAHLTVQSWDLFFAIQKIKIQLPVDSDHSNMVSIFVRKSVVNSWLSWTVQFIYFSYFTLTVFLSHVILCVGSYHVT